MYNINFLWGITNNQELQKKLTKTCAGHSGLSSSAKLVLCVNENGHKRKDCTADYLLESQGRSVKRP